MKKINLLLMAAIMICGFTITSCSSDDDKKVEPPVDNKALNQELAGTWYEEYDINDAITDASGKTVQLLNGTVVNVIKFNADGTGEYDRYFFSNADGDEAMSLEMTWDEEEGGAFHYTSTADGGGDGSEFIVLTNRLDKDVSLDDVRITCSKEKKGVVDPPSLDLTLDGGKTIAAGGTLKLAKADCWPTSKITNGNVAGTISDAAGATVQTFYVSADWWNKACDGTGAHFVALDFASVATALEQWTNSFPRVDSAAARAVVAAAATNEAVKAWLDKTGETQVGRDAIAAFDGDADALWQCYLVDSKPEADPEIELVIPDIAFDASGNPVVGGVLLQHDAPQAKTVNGAIKLYYAEELGDLPASTDAVPLGKTFPVDPDSVELPSSDVRFFQLRLVDPRPDPEPSGSH